MASSSRSSIMATVPGRSLRSRTSRRLLVVERVRHKRQVLQDMARPLKQWLIRHRRNPYPTKAEKIVLALGSQMTLVQVNNWFANARRRLKNVVGSPDLPWAQRIRQYNSLVEGNAELLSICSNDSIWDEDEVANQPETVHLKDEHSYSANGSNQSDASFPPKYKSDILERYLRDTWTQDKQLQDQGVDNRYWEELDAALTLTRLATVTERGT